MRREEETKTRMESYLRLSRIGRRDDPGGACNDLLCGVSRLFDRRRCCPDRPATGIRHSKSGFGTSREHATSLAFPGAELEYRLYRPKTDQQIQLTSAITIGLSTRALKRWHTEIALSTHTVPLPRHSEQILAVISHASFARPAHKDGVREVLRLSA